MGGYFGGRLAQAGEDVTFVARGEHLRAIQTKGLKVESRNGDFTIYPAKATDRISDLGTVDLIIVGVKAWQVPEAARALKPIVGSPTTVLPLQNGVDASTQLIAELGADAVIGGLCKIVSFVVGPGHIRHAGFAPSTVIGEMDNRQTVRIQSIAATLNRAGIETAIAPDIEVALWMKFLFIASFSGMGAITGAAAGILRTEFRARVIQAMEEIYTLAHARGIKLPPDAIATVMAGVDALPADATSSMQRDIAAGKPSELDSQNGAVVRMAHDAGIEVPVHEAIYAQLKPLEEKARGVAAQQSA